MPEPPFDLTGRVAIITGGGTGIGRATALLLARYGADVVLASRKVENLERVAKEVRSATGRRALPVQTDVRVQSDAERLARQTVQEFGRIDILVNNAGGNRRVRLEETPTEVWDNMVNLNLRGPFLCSLAVGKVMIQQKRGGAIVNISSGASRGPGGTWGIAPYAAAKAGLNRLTEMMAGEWGKYGIRCNCIAVGAIKTEGFIRNRVSLNEDPEAMASRNALGRGGVPDDIAYTILFLVSDASSFITGQTIGVNGGPRFD